MSTEERECHTTNSRSRVSRLLAAIEQEYVAAERGMSGYAVVSTHTAITRHMERMTEGVNELVRLVGDEHQAMTLVAERLDQAGEDPHA